MTVSEVLTFLRAFGSVGETEFRKERPRGPGLEEHPQGEQSPDLDPRCRDSGKGVSASDKLFSGLRTVGVGEESFRNGQAPTQTL